MSVKKKIAVILLSVAVAVSLGGLICSLVDDHLAKIAYDESKTLAGLPETGKPSLPEAGKEIPEDGAPADGDTVKEPEGGQTEESPEPPEEEPAETDEVMEMLKNELDIAALREINSDVCAWIYIPDTELSYPVLSYTDNDYYLKRNWKKEKSRSGSVFTDYRSGNDFEGFNTVIYGHRMSNGTMFGSLAAYESKEHFESNPYVYVVTEKSVIRYRIFSAYEAKVAGSHTYDFGIDNKEKLEAYVLACVESSIHESGFSPVDAERVITLSTCTKSTVYDYKTRWVIHAVQTAKIEK